MFRKKVFIIIDTNQSLKRNLAIMWFANFFVSGSMTMVIPFISLYIESMGNFSDSYVQTWSGLTFAVSFIAAFIFSPIWGRFGDKYGRKKILIISAFGIGISVFLMGFATTVWHFFIASVYGNRNWVHPHVTGFHINTDTKECRWQGAWHTADRKYYRFINGPYARWGFSRCIRLYEFV